MCGKSIANTSMIQGHYRNYPDQINQSINQTDLPGHFPEVNKVVFSKYDFP